MKWWIKKLFLSVSDREKLTSGSELNDAVINAAQLLLKKQFPQISGFQNTLYGSNLGFKALSVNSDSVQVIHDGMFCLFFFILTILRETFCKN